MGNVRSISVVGGLQSSTERLCCLTIVAYGEYGAMTAVFWLEWLTSFVLKRAKAPWGRTPVKSGYHNYISFPWGPPCVAILMPIVLYGSGESFTTDFQFPPFGRRESGGGGVAATNSLERIGHLSFEYLTEGFVASWSRSWSWHRMTVSLPPARLQQSTWVTLSGLCKL